MKIYFELITPEKIYFQGKIDMVVISGEEGDFGVMACHAPIITTLRPGLLEIHDDNSISSQLFIESGFVKVTDEGCIVLAENITELSALNIDKCKEELSNIRNIDSKEESLYIINKRIKVLQAMIDISSHS